MRSPLPADQILNVNVPDLPLAQIKGIRVARLGCRHPAETVIVEQDHAGIHLLDWSPGSKSGCGEEPILRRSRQGYVSITPLQIDITAYRHMDGLQEWIKGL